MSGESFLSASWYRLARLRPALKPQARVRRHRFRGQAWYVVHDTASGRFNRFTPAAWQLLGLMDGQRTMDEGQRDTGEQENDPRLTRFVSENVQLGEQTYGLFSMSRLVRAPDFRQAAL